MLAAALLVATLSDLESPEALRQYARLNGLAAMSRYDSERAAFLVRTKSGALRAVDWQSGTQTEATYTGRIPQNAIAVMHTHPVVAPNPSKRDVAEAQRIGLPIVVITADQITVANPDGTTTMIPRWSTSDSSATAKQARSSTRR
jgi:proteasome lid subunit RPN8/RPN11